MSNNFNFYKECHDRFVWNKSPKCVELNTPPKARFRNPVNNFHQIIKLAFIIGDNWFTVSLLN